MPKKEKDCPFCDVKKIASPVKSYGDVLVFEPLDPVVEGHRLVVPRQHVADFAENPKLTAKVMMIAAEIAQKEGGEFNIITSKGRNATQSVFHLHVHLVPRKEGDNLALPWTGQHEEEA